ncbi:hypothetical protein [Nocardia jiangxiensis]|uniref:hypothetical protein n=1 Tax=Nocardia jiangxiensis TaxID=282685 RepID=UPI0002F20BB7|nr:hypothetical protein [Nocardia jiangxiensis]
MKAHSRFVDRGAPRRRSGRMYVHGYHSSNPDAILGTLVWVVVASAVFVLVLLAVFGRSDSAQPADTVPVRLTAPPTSTYTPPPCFPFETAC